MATKMVMTARYVGIIPARGGSRRLPDKNLLQLGGRSLIQWTIDAAANSELSRVIVSTDSERIAEAARAGGAEVPFIRPAELATDRATTASVVLHALGWLRAEGDTSTHAVVLQPTTPLRTAQDINGAIELREERNADSIVTVCPAECPVAWINPLPPDGSMAEFYRRSVRAMRSQDHAVAYRPNGAVYIYDIERALDQQSLEMDDSTFAYIMPRERSVDIDDETDLVFAEALADRTFS